jgi:hypothetical protein
MAGVVCGRLRRVHDHAGQHGCQRRAAVDPGRPASRTFEFGVGGQCLRPVVRRSAADRGPARRLIRPPPRLPHRPRRIYRGVTAGRTGAHRGRPDRRARAPGRRRRADDPPDARDHQSRLPRREAARHRHRPVGRCSRPRCRARPGHRRPRGAAHRLELDLLHQRPRRHHRCRRCRPLHPRIARPRGHSAPRCTGTRPIQRGAVQLDLCANQGQRPRLGVARRSSPCSSPRSPGWSPSSGSSGVLTPR